MAILDRGSRLFATMVHEIMLEPHSFDAEKLALQRGLEQMQEELETALRRTPLESVVRPRRRDKVRLFVSEKREREIIRRIVEEECREALADVKKRLRAVEGSSEMDFGGWCSRKSLSVKTVVGMLLDKLGLKIAHTSARESFSLVEPEKKSPESDPGTSEE